MDNCSNQNLNIEINGSKIQKPKKHLANTQDTRKTNIEQTIVEIDDQLNKLPHTPVKSLDRRVAQIRDKFFELLNQLNGIEDIREFCSNGRGGAL